MKLSRSINRNRRGSALVATLLFGTVLTTIVGSYLSMTLKELRIAHESVMRGQLMALTEAGAEEAARCINNQDWSQWSKDESGTMYKTIASLKAGIENAIVRVKVVDWKGNKPRVIADATSVTKFGTLERKQIDITLSRRNPFDTGLIARRFVVFNGNNFEVNAFDSRETPSGLFSEIFKLDQGSVGSLSVEVGSINLGNADIWGYVATGGAMPSVGPNGSVKGNDTPSGVNVDTNRIATDFQADFPLVDAPTLSGATTSITDVKKGTTYIGASGTAENPAKYVLDSWSASANYEVTGPTIMVVTDAIDVKGTITIAKGASLTLYVKGDFSVGGNGDVNNATGYAKNLVIYGTNKVDGGQDISLAGNGALTAIVYAPNANLTLGGGGSTGGFTGAAVAYTAKINGGSSRYQFHYDISIRDDFSDKRVKMDQWREITSTTERNSNFYPISANYLSNINQG